MPINTIELRKTKRQRIIIYVISPFHHATHGPPPTTLGGGARYRETKTEMF